MNTKTISPRALSVIDQYMNFRVGSAVCPIPYFNNKTMRAKLALRAYVGKGSPEDIFEEVKNILLKNHTDANSLTNESLKKLLVDNNIGIDCSGFAYYILNAESMERGKGHIDKHLSFVNCHGFLGKIRCAMRPVENCDVATLSNDRNSKQIMIVDIQPGDIITMTDNSVDAKRDHILIIHQIEYQNFIPVKIHYSHAVAYPEDGIYGNGIKQGYIEIINSNKTIQEGRWFENNKTGNENRIFSRAQKSRTELRRLGSF